MSQFDLQSLLKALYAERVSMRGPHRARWFWGTDSLYSQLATQLAALAANEAASQLAEACPAGQSFTVSDLCKLSDNPRLGQLALLRLADNHYDADPLIACLAEETGNVHKPTQHEEDWYKEASSYLNARISHSTPHWTGGYWRALGFVNDWLNRTGQPLKDSYLERTPILVANEATNQTVSRVLWLVAERIPGPPIVTPHWWKLGQVHLGNPAPEPPQTPELQYHVQSTIEQTLQNRNWRWQVRWWLETYPNGGGWHEQIGQAPSIQAAAACLTLALGETDAIRPVLDPQAAVSATCNSLGQIGDVGAVSAKIQACKKAGIHCLVLIPKLVTQHRPATAEQHSTLQLLLSEKLEDVYEILRSTSPQLQQAKQNFEQEWKKKYKETETEAAFIKASE